MASATQFKLTCDFCDESITEEYLPVDGKSYHYGCFICGDCNEPITGGKYCKRDGYYLCEPCDALYAPQCFGCAKPIWEEHTMCDGLSFHRACFCCAVCEQAISGAHGRRRSDTLPVCQECKKRAAPKCARCKGAALSQHYSADNEIYHIHCFACTDCRRLITGTYYRRENSLLCQNCESGRAPQCGRCRQPIWTEHPTVNGMPLHKECFVCNICRCSIGGSFFPTGDGGIMCMPCHDGGHEPECGGCKQPVLGERLLVQGQVFHAECFCCGKCNANLSHDGGEVRQWNGVHLCHNCAEDEKKSPTCHVCNTEIEGRVMTLEGNVTYHPACFQCTKCSKPITGTFTTETAGPLCLTCQPRCHFCHGDLSGRECVKKGDRSWHAECHQEHIEQNKPVVESGGTPVGNRSPSLRGVPGFPVMAEEQEDSHALEEQSVVPRQVVPRPRGASFSER